MYEFKRIHLKWNTLILILGLILCQIFAYIYSETTFESVSEIRDRIADTKEAIEKNDYEQLTYQTEYFKEYNLYYDSIIRNAEKMAATAEKGSFAEQNILKTIEDYKSIDGIKLTYGIDEKVQSFVGFEITDYLILAFLIYIIVRYFEGRRTGLEAVVRVGAKGRFNLTVSRIIILAADSIFITGIFYFVQYLLTGYLYGFENDRIIQSIAMFKQCNIAMTEGKFFIIYALMKAAVLFTFAMVIWFIMHIFKSMVISAAVIVVIFASQYIIYEQIEYTSHYVIAKFINLFAWLDVENQFVKYYNIDFFGIPVGIRELFFLSLVLAGSMGFFIVIREVFCYGKIELNFIKKIYTRFLGFVDRHRKQGYIFTWELKKILIKNKGIVVLLIIGFIAKNYIVDADLQLNGSAGNSRSDYYKEYGYDIDKAMYEDIICAKDEYNKALTEYETAAEAYDNDEIDRGEFLKFERQLDEKSQQYSFFSEVEIDIAYVEKMREQGKNAMLITKDGYEYLLNRNNHIVDLRKMLIVLLASIFLLGGIFSSDRQTGAINIIKASGKGRNKLFYSKIKAGMILVTLCSVTMFFVEFYNIWKLYGFSGLECSVYSLYLLEKFPFDISLRSFIILWYLCRWTVIMSVCMIIMCISCMSKNILSSMWITIGVLGIPAFLTYIEVPFVKYISVLEPMWLMKVWLNNSPDNLTSYLPMIIMWIIGVISFMMCRKYYRYKNT